MPDDDYLRETSAKDIITTILEPSNSIIAKINDYLEGETMSENTTSNYYIRKDNKIFYLTETQCEDIHSIILDLNNINYKREITRAKPSR